MKTPSIKKLNRTVLKMIKMLIIFLFLVYPTIGFADAGWKAKRTANFTVFYRKGYEGEATKLLSILEHYRKMVIGVTGHKGDKHSLVVLHDAGIVVGGFYFPFLDRIGILTYPPSREFSVENWYRLVGVHEYTHELQITNTRGLPKVLTSLFGTLYHPNLYLPGFLIEGIATYAESQPSLYEGRLNEGYFASYLKTRAKENKFPSFNTVIHSPFEYPGGEGIYLYGGLFFQYLAKTYGEDKLSLLFSSIGSSIGSYFNLIFPFLGLDRAARSVYGKSIPSLFKEWRKYEEENAKEWITEGERLTKNGWYVAYPILHNDRLYYYRSYPKKTGAYEFFEFSEIVARDLESGKEKVLVRLTSSIHTPMRLEGECLYYGVYEVKKGYKGSFDDFGFGYVSSIYERDLKTGKNRLLFTDEVRSFAPLSSDEILYAKDIKGEFGSTLMLYSKKKREKKVLFTIPYIISEILPTKEGIFVVARKDWENWNVYKLCIKEGTLTPVIDTPFGETSISFDDGILYFTANYGGVYRVYAYNLKNKKLFRLTEAFSDYPIVSPKENRLYFVGLTSMGYDLFSKELELKEFVVPEHKKTQIPDFPSLEVKDVGYVENLKALFPPKIRTPFGFIGADAVGENFYMLSPYFYVSSNKKRDVRIGLYAFIHSTYFKPSVFSLKFATDKETSARWTYPLIHRLAPVSSFFNALLEAGLKDKFKNRYIAPGIRARLRLSHWDAYVETKYNIESEKKGLDVASSLRRYILNSHIAFSFYYDYKKKIVPRSSKDTLDNLLRCEYSLPLFKIRRGLWNPNIYFEDLFIVPFAEGYYDRKERSFSLLGGGVELRQEVSMGLGYIKFPICLGFRVDREGKRIVYVYVKGEMMLLE